MVADETMEQKQIIIVTLLVVLAAGVGVYLFRNAALALMPKQMKHRIDSALEPFRQEIEGIKELAKTEPKKAEKE